MELSIASLGLACVLFVPSLAEKLETCHRNPCENGGTCYRISKFIISENPCKIPFNTRYGHSCYMLGDRSLSWTQAQQHCGAGNYDASLAAFETQDELEFLTKMLHDATQSSYHRPQVWLAGAYNETLGGHLPFSWLKIDGRSNVEKWAWSYFDATAGGYTMHTDSRMMLTPGSGYRKWGVSNKTAKGWYICEKPAFERDEETYAYQCRCEGDYEGAHCELKGKAKHDQTAEFHSWQLNKCSLDNGGLLFQCPVTEPRETIEVDYVAFGRPVSRNDPTCGGSTVDSLCHAPEAFVKVRQICGGRRKCILPPLSELFPLNPCHEKTKLFLEYRMRCTPAADKIRCPQGAQKLGDRCFQVFRQAEHERLRFQEATEFCQKRNGDLIGPINSALHDWIEVVLKGPRESYWMSLVNNGSQNIWRTTGEVLRSQDFVPQGSILNNGHSCGTIQNEFELYSDGHKDIWAFWRMRNCDAAFSFICEFSTTSESEAARLLLDEKMATSLTPPELVTTSSTTIPEPSTTELVVTGIPTTTSTITTSTTTTPKTTTTTTPKTTTTITTTTTPKTTTTIPTTTTLRTTTTTEQPSTTTEQSTTEQPTTTTIETTTEPTTDPVFTATRSVVVETTPKLACPSTTLNGVTWPTAGVGGVSAVPCPDGERFMKRECLETGEFGSIDEVECSHPESAALFEKARNSSVDQTETMRNLTVRISSDDVTSRDLSLAVETVHRSLETERRAVYELPQPKRAQKFTDYAKASGEASDKIISREPLWDQMTADQRLAKGSQWMVNTQRCAEALGEFLATGSQESFTFENMQVRIVRQKRVSAVLHDGTGNGTGRDRWPSQPQSDQGATGQMDLATIELPEIFVLSQTTEPNHGDSSTQNDAVSSNDLKLGYYLYTKHVQDVFKPDQDENGTIINAHIVGASVNDPTVSKSLPEGQFVTLDFYHINTAGYDWEESSCVFWNLTSKSWDESGCEVLSRSPLKTTCQCNHLTAFTVLMGAKLWDPVHQKIIDVVTAIGCIVSIVCLVCCIIVFTFVRSIWSPRNTIHRNLCICLLVAQFLFIFGVERGENWSESGCTAIAAGLHYFFLAAFAWMLLEGYQLYVMLVRVFESSRSSTWAYILFGYGFPMVVVVCALAGLRGDYGYAELCWIRPHSTAMYAFLVPVAFVITLNIGALLLAMKTVIFDTGTLRDKSKLKKFAGWVKGAVFLLCLFGTTWVFGYLLILNMGPTLNRVFAYLFCIFNSLQGLFIFWFHVLLNDKVYTAWSRVARRRFPCLYPGGPCAKSSTANSATALKRQSDTSNQTLSTSDHHVSCLSEDGDQMPIVMPDVPSVKQPNAINRCKQVFGEDHLCSARCEAAFGYAKTAATTDFVARF